MVDEGFEHIPRKETPITDSTKDEIIKRAGFLLDLKGDDFDSGDFVYFRHGPKSIDITRTTKDETNTFRKPNYEINIYEDLEVPIGSSVSKPRIISLYEISPLGVVTKDVKARTEKELSEALDRMPEENREESISNLSRLLVKKMQQDAVKKKLGLDIVYESEGKELLGILNDIDPSIDYIPPYIPPAETTE